jgi:quinol monooxygenase YgiN
MSEPIVFISHFKVKEGKLDSLKQQIQTVTEQIKANKPGTVVFLQYLNEEGTELSIVHMFPDTESYDRHLEGVAERAKAAFETIALTRREVYGLPGDKALAITKPPDGSGVTFRLMPQLAGGYIRLNKAA